MLMDLFDRYDDNIAQHTIINLIVTIAPYLLGHQVNKAES